MERTAALRSAGPVVYTEAHADRAAFGLPGARREWLCLLERHLADRDWLLLAYALLDDRALLVLEAGVQPLESLMVPLCHSHGRWLRETHAAAGPTWRAGGRDRDGTHGPGFAAGAIMGAHNAPVRAGHREAAWACSWTSHRAYVRLAPRPSYLHAARGLALCGLADTAAGRRLFDERTLVVGAKAPGRRAGDVQRAATLRPPRRARDEPTAVVRRAKRATADPPQVAAEQAEQAVSVQAVLAQAGAALGVAPLSIALNDGSELLVLARRAIVWCWVRALAGTPAALAPALASTASDLAGELAAMDADQNHVARRLGQRLARDLAEPGTRTGLGVPRAVRDSPPGSEPPPTLRHPGVALPGLRRP